MKVVDLRWARMLEGRPTFIPASRAGKGAKGEGLRYERGLAKGLGQRFRYGIWWEYGDLKGKRYCQTDFFGRAKDWIVLLESKLTWTLEAEEQLHGMYVPIVAYALQVPRTQVLPIVVCKYLTGETVRPIESSLKGSIQAAMQVGADMCVVWHHMGGVPRLKEMGDG
jgi:hypothetical protein